MGEIQVYWDNPEQTIIHIALYEIWTWEDFEGIFPQLQTMSSANPTLTAAIVDSPDGSADDYVPPGTLFKLLRLQSLYRYLDVIVLVNAGSLTQLIIQNLNRINPTIGKRFVLVDDVKTARQFISELYASSSSSQ